MSNAYWKHQFPSCGEKATICFCRQIYFTTTCFDRRCAWLKKRGVGVGVKSTFSAELTASHNLQILLTLSILYLNPRVMMLVQQDTHQYCEGRSLARGTGWAAQEFAGPPRRPRDLFPSRPHRSDSDRSLPLSNWQNNGIIEKTKMFFKKRIKVEFVLRSQ